CTALNSAGETYIIYPTNFKGHATELVRQILTEGGKEVLILGGDGTIHGVINGLNQDDDVVLGILPAGTGNDVATMLNLPSGYENIKLCMQNILGRNVKSIDYMIEKKGKQSMLFFSYGIAANMVMSMEKFEKKTKLSYYRAIVKHMFGYKAKTYQLSIDDGEPRELAADFLGLHNCIHAGGGMQLVHNAVIDDGVAEVFIVHYRGKLRRIANLIAITSGKVHKQPNVEIIRAKNIEINSPDNNLCCSDGEIILTNKLDLKVIHKGIKIFGK
ncbi:MAG: hypothetical protein FWE44_06140, partial [Defluviitaleaceae bacterium]|nr:hypothetical protein [Defluviitaleaceae bacterium]